MGTLWKDLRYAARVLVKSPGFSAVVILSLALAIGANAAIFGLVNAFVLRPMPVDNPDRLVAIYVSAPNSGANIKGFSYPELLDYRKQDTGLSDIMGSTGLPLSMTDGEKPELIWGEVVTGNYFSGLGVRPVVGRGFAPDEDKVPGAKAVCVLNFKFWTRHFQSDPNIVGKSIKIDGHPFTIVGVAPHGFIGTVAFNFIPDVWIPVMMQPTIAASYGNFLEGRGNRWMAVRGRLKPGVTERQAEAALNVVARQLANEYPETNQNFSTHLLPGGARTQPFLITTGMIPATTAIMALAVTLVLLIACANIANLMLARGASRAREMAIRMAVGAGRSQLVRQLFTESVLLALAGGALGIMLAMWFSDSLKNFYPSLDFQTTDLDYDGRLDPRLFPFTILVSMLAAVLFGLFPALRASKVDQASAMKGQTGSLTVGRVRIGSGNLLVMAQVALSSVLLICGGLFLRSMQFAHNVDPGFDRSGITMFGVNLDLQGYDEARGLVFQQTLINRLRSVPGVDAAAAAFPLPLDAYQNPISVYPEGYVPRSAQEINLAGRSTVSPGYFETMGTRLLAGRVIDQRDTSSSTPVAVINETMARRYWQSTEGAIGRHFSAKSGGPLFEVIGVARNGKYFTFGESATPYVYTALTQDHQGQVTMLVRSKQDPETLVPLLRAQVSALDPALPMFGVRSMPQFLNRTLSIYEAGASLVGTFAITALLLAAVGIYGVLHFTVARRTREIGIRMALGARQGQVLSMVLSKSLLYVTAGILIGVGLALSAGRLTQTVLAGVSGADPLTFFGVLFVFALIVVIASAVPARRASRVDPMQALRHD
jgi:predicted permease